MTQDIEIRWTVLVAGTVIALGGAGDVIAGALTHDWITYAAGIGISLVGVLIQTRSERTSKRTSS